MSPAILDHDGQVLSDYWKLDYREVPDWPKLAWLAVIERGAGRVTLLHGPCVETKATWCAEAVWPGDFAQGDFDQSDVVIGSGLRVRGESMVFVSSSDTLNRLYHYEEGETLYVSNSLPAVMALADLSLCTDFNYGAAMASIMRGLDGYVRKIPTNKAPIGLLCFNNLRLDAAGLSEIAKPSLAPEFTDFAGYRDYLFATAEAVGANARAPERRNSMAPLASLSNGYDSPATAVLARAAGAQSAVTIPRARRIPSNLTDLDDSGAPIAERLGLTCTAYARERTNYPFEDALWAAMGNVGDLNLTLFDYPSPLCLLFTGFMGDVLWEKTTRKADALCRKDTSGARFSECRLELGVFNCAPAFWGCRQEAQILALSHSPEMAPWSVGGDYDRPIPRRIAEEAGVPRSAFGKKKHAASFNRRFGRPLSRDLSGDFTAFVQRHGGRTPSPSMERLSLGFRALDSLVLTKLPPALRFSSSNWISLPSPSMFFIWANKRRKQRYLAGLRRSAKSNLDAKQAAVASS